MEKSGSFRESGFDISIIAREIQRFSFNDLSASQEFILEHGARGDEIRNIIVSDYSRLLITLIKSEQTQGLNTEMVMLAVAQNSPKCLLLLLRHGLRVDWSRWHQSYQMAIQHQSNLIYVKSILITQAKIDHIPLEMIRTIQKMPI